MNKSALLVILISSIILLLSAILLCLNRENYTIINDQGELTDIESKTGVTKPIVFLYSEVNRYWESTADNHKKIINKLSDNDDNNVIIGINYWNHNGNAEAVVPREIAHFNHKASVIDDHFGFRHVFDFERSILQLKKFIFSTRVALQNAEALYIEKFGIEMPDNQAIVRLRYDCFIEDIDLFPLPLTDDDYYYISTWNTDHRHYDKDHPEIADAAYITTKRVINSLINVDLDQFVDEINKTEDVGTFFPERALYHLLKYLNVNIIFDFDLKTSLIRANNEKTVLSK